MRKFLNLACALGFLVAGAFLNVSTSQGQGPSIETRTLMEQGVDQLPDSPLCWDVRSGSLAAGSASPTAGYHTHGLVVTYVFDGTERIEYEDGSAVTLDAGDAALIAHNVAHRHESVGSAARRNLNFELTCEAQANSRGNTGLLEGVWPERGAYRIQLRERLWPTGAQTPVHVISGPTSTYVVEGTIQRSTASMGAACSNEGQLYVSPVGELAQNTSVGSVAARTLDVDLWPVGEPRTVPQGESVRVWQKWPAPQTTGPCPGAE